MKALIYVNQLKSDSRNFVEKFSAVLDSESVNYQVITRENFSSDISADVVFVYGGDGTILALTEFCAKNKIPVIGFNAGKMGFLSEFEIDESQKAVRLFKEGLLKNDVRSILKISSGNSVFYALNDAVIQRIYNEQNDGLIISVSVYLDGIFVDEITGDGVIVSTPTGSTAYSLSAGGAILSPGINAFIITPLSAHSLHHRPIVFSAQSSCEINIKSDCAALFVDGKKTINLNCGDKIIIQKAVENITFLRKKDSNFYRILDEKLNK